MEVGWIKVTPEGKKSVPSPGKAYSFGWGGEPVWILLVASVRTMLFLLETVIKNILE